MFTQLSQLLLLAKSPRWVTKELLDQLAAIRDKILVIAVAYNNPWVIELQHKLLKKFFCDPFVYFLADNSDCEEASRQIRGYAENNEILYVKLPPMPFNKKLGSYGHGLAMNYVFRHYVQYCAISYFGFVDHDCFPVAEYKGLEAHLQKQGLYGHLQEREPRWYLWAGFCFFNRRIFPQRMNFLPQPGLDTGGGNYTVVYQHLQKEVLNYPEHFYIQVNTEEITRTPDRSRDIRIDHVEMIDQWMHLFQAFDLENERYGDKKKFLRRYLERLECV